MLIRYLITDHLGFSQVINLIRLSKVEIIDEVLCGKVLFGEFLVFALLVMVVNSIFVDHIYKKLRSPVVKNQ